jgi:peptidyl-prolyl cis-trans isomerase D
MLMRQMRQNTKWIMIITAAAFVALMVFEWGADMSGQSAGGDMGRIGGTTVSPQLFQETYRSLYDQISRSQDSPISTQQNREIEDMAWEQLVSQVLIQKELQRRGIRVSNEEIRQAARFAPLPEFRNDPAFHTDGRFDLQKYHDFLAQMAGDPEFARQLEMIYRDMIPREKLVRQLTSGVYISDHQLWTEWRDSNERVEVSFLVVDPAGLFPDAEVEVSRREVEEHYRANREDFRVPARARVLYTYLDQTPSPADTAAAWDRAGELRQDILDGEGFGDVARRESGDQASAVEGGRLGTVGRGDLVGPLDQAAFTQPVGQVGEPVQTRFGLHLLEVISREGDQAEIRHILIPFERTTQSEIALLTRADSLEALGRNQTLTEAARSLGLEVYEGEITQDFAVLPGVGVASEGQDWIFEDREGPGAVSPVFETPDAFYMLEIVRESRAGFLPLEDVAREIEETIRTRKRTERAMEMAREWGAELRAGNLALDGLAERVGGEVQRPSPFTRTDFVPGLGARNAAVGAAFGTPDGGIGGPVRVQNRVVLLRVEGRIEADREAWEEQKEEQRARRVQEVRQDRLERWLDGLRETVRIVDRRAEYYRAVEAAEDRPQIPLAF